MNGSDLGTARRRRAAFVLLLVLGCGGETASTPADSSSSDPDTSGAPPGETSSDSAVATMTSSTTATSETSAADSSSGDPAFECGNAVLEPGELCDDGNDVEDDECTSLCLPPECGDGIVQRSLGESCDDGNDENLDACPSDCLGTMCGDGFAEGLEECDHGTDNGNGTSSCTATCMLNVCGDGYLLVTAGEVCDEGAANGDGISTCAPTCRLNVCGDGYLATSANELCDEGEDNGIGLCTSNCTDRLLAGGYAHTCARGPAGNVRCWGSGSVGALGYASTDDIGDDETPVQQGDVDVGGTVVDLDAGNGYTCAVLEGGAVRCWGRDDYAQLGYPDGENVIGDDETPASAGDIDLGGPARQIACGLYQTCALLQDGTVRCWGRGATGTPGYGASVDGELVAIGIDLAPSAPEALVDLGGQAAVRISADEGHTCAVMQSGDVRCWGADIFGWFGYGVAVGTIGDDETPGTLDPLPIGRATQDVSLNAAATCVRFADGDVKCVGGGGFGFNAAGSGLELGDDEVFEDVPAVMLGMQAARLRGGRYITCAIAGAGNARCWGLRTGYADAIYVGDDETPADIGDLPIDEPIVDVSGGGTMTCVLTFDGGIRCWGDNVDGALGYGNTTPQPLAAVATDVPFE